MRLFYYPATHSLSSAARGVAHAFADLLVCTGLNVTHFQKQQQTVPQRKKRNSPAGFFY
jgi:hypothetical protein